jgi:RNase P subunit RPR2
MSTFQCSGCHKPHVYAPYAIAQLSQGHTLTFTCSCGKETALTPSKYRKARDRIREARMVAPS